MSTPVNEGEEQQPEFRADTRQLSCICDGCVTRSQAKNERVRLWGCDICHALACWHMLSINDLGKRVCSRCPLT